MKTTKQTPKLIGVPLIILLLTMISFACSSAVPRTFGKVYPSGDSRSRYGYYRYDLSSLTEVEGAGLGTITQRKGAILLATNEFVSKSFSIDINEPTGSVGVDYVVSGKTAFRVLIDDQEVFNLGVLPGLEWSQPIVPLHDTVMPGKHTITFQLRALDKRDASVTVRELDLWSANVGEKAKSETK